MSWSIYIYPTFVKFLVRTGPTIVSQLEQLHGVDLAAGLEEASPMQREMILAAIQFHLRTPSVNGEYLNDGGNGIYYDSDNGRIIEGARERTIEEQNAIFEALEVTGITFQEVMSAPRLQLNIRGGLIDGLMLGRVDGLQFDRSCCIYYNHPPAAAHNYLLNSIAIEARPQFFTTLPERAFLATALLNEPELILGITRDRNYVENILNRNDEENRPIFREITSQHITTALDTVSQNPWAAPRFLVNLEQMQDSERNTNARGISCVLNNSDNQYIRQALHTVIQDPQALHIVVQNPQAISFISQNLDILEIISPMLFRSHMNAAELRDAIYYEAIHHIRGICDELLEFCIIVIRSERAGNWRLITDPLHIGPMDSDVVHDDVGGLVLSYLNAHDILQVVRAEEEYFDAPDTSQQEQDLQIGLAMSMEDINVSPIHYLAYSICILQ